MRVQIIVRAAAIVPDGAPGRDVLPRNRHVRVVVVGGGGGCGVGGGGGEDRVLAPSAVVEEAEVVLAGERVAAAAVVAEGVAVGGCVAGARAGVFVILEAGAKTGRVLVQEVQLAKKTRTGVSATSGGEEAGEGGKGRAPRIRRISRRHTWRE